MRCPKQNLALLLIGVNVLLGCLPARLVASEPAKIMPLGDSITRGYYVSVGHNGYRKPLYLSLISGGYDCDFVGSQTDGDADPNHEGHGGQVASWLNPRMNGPDEYWLPTYQPDIILYHIGTNDLVGSDIATYAQDANETLEKIYEFDPNTAVVLAKIILTRDDPARNTRTQNYNLLLENIAQDWADAGYSIIIVDMESALNYSTDMGDPLHPNDAGYSKMAAVWYEALDNLIAAPMITSTPTTEGTIGWPYTYDADANGYPEPTYSLTVYPDGMTIDPNSGLIEWTPAAIGDFNVTIEASNGQPPDTNQSFTITVSSVICFDAASSASSNSNDTTLSWVHRIGDSNNRILVVGIAGEDQNTGDLVINSVSYDNIDMNLVEASGKMITSGSPPTHLKTELYYLLDTNLPSTAGDYTISVTYEGNVKFKCAGAVSLENAEQQAAEAVATNSNESNDIILTDITTLTNGSLVVDIVACSNDGLFSPDTLGMEQRWDANSSSSAAAGSSKLIALEQTTTMGWNYSSGANQMTHSAAAFAPAGCTISGHILEPNEAPIEQILVSADDGGSSDMTDPNGFYELSVYYNWSGIVTPTGADNLFTPSQRTYSNVVADQAYQDYKDISAYNLNGDGFIGWGDIAVICEYWLKTEPDSEGDFNDDGVVDILDFAEFALFW